MKEIKWINPAEQKPADEQMVLVMSRGLNSSKEPVTSRGICNYRNGVFWNAMTVTVTQGDQYEMVAKVSWDMKQEGVFAWTDLESICELCKIEPEDAK